MSSGLLPRMRPWLTSGIQRPGVLFAVVITAAMVAFYGFGVATGRQVFFTNETAINTFSAGSDLWHLNIPWKYFYAQELHHLRLPFWCPLMGTGMPLLAEGEVAALQPLNLLLFGLLPFPLALNWSILLHLILGGVFTALFAYELGAGRLGGLLAGVVFAFSGFLVPHVKHVNIVQTAAWIPLLLLLLERYRHARRPGTLALLAVAVALMWLSGHPQIAYYGLLIGAVYAAVLTLGILRDGAAGPGRGRRALGFNAGALLAVALGVGLAAPQLLPTLELNRIGPRRQADTCDGAIKYDYPPRYAVTFLRPMAFGDPGELRPTPESAVDPAGPRLTGFRAPSHINLFWEISGYVGLLPLGLASVGLAVAWRRRRALAVLTILVLSAILVLGEHGGLIRAFCRLPGFTSFRHHTRFLLFVDLGLAVLAGVGCGWLVERLRARRRWLAAGVGAALVVTCFVDLAVAYRDHNPTIAPARWLTPPETARRIAAEEAGRQDPFRIAVLDVGLGQFANAYRLARGWKGDLGPYDRVKELIYPNANLLYGLAEVNFRAPLYPAWTEKEENVAIGVLPAHMAAYNVRYVLVPHHDRFDLARPVRVDERLPLVATFPGDRLYDADGERYEIHLHRVPDALPRAVLVPRARLVPNALAEISSPGFDPRREVVIEWERSRRPRIWPGGSSDPIDSAVEFVRYEPQLVQLKVRAPRRCWLFLSDTYEPSWEARVDGAVVPVHRANFAGRAIEVPAGAHEVTFSYRARAFWNGLLIALGSVGGLGVVVALGRRRRDPPASG